MDKVKDKHRHIEKDKDRQRHMEKDNRNTFTFTERHKVASTDLLLADTGQEAAVVVPGVVSCCRGLVALLLGVVLLPEVGRARLASERGEVSLSERGDVHGEEVRGRTRAGLGAESRAGSTWNRV